MATYSATKYGIFRLVLERACSNRCKYSLRRGAALSVSPNQRGSSSPGWESPADRSRSASLIPRLTPGIYELKATTKCYCSIDDHAEGVSYDGTSPSVATSDTPIPSSIPATPAITSTIVCPMLLKSPIFLDTVFPPATFCRRLTVFPSFPLFFDADRFFPSFALFFSTIFFPFNAFFRHRFSVCHFFSTTPFSPLYHFFRHRFFPRKSPSTG